MRLKNLLIFCIIFLFHLPAKADFISLIRADKCETIIEIYVEDGQVRVIYEIGLLDWQYFKEIIPPELLQERLQNPPKSKGENFFYNNVFTINADGKNLIGKIVRQELMPRKYRASLYTGVVDENNDVSKEMMFVEVIYPLVKNPKKIIITPPIHQGMKSTKANIGFITYHKKIPVNDLRYLSEACTLNLVWRDPWYSKFNNVNLLSSLIQKAIDNGHLGIKNAEITADLIFIMVEGTYYYLSLYDNDQVYNQKLNQYKTSAFDLLKLEVPV